MEQKPGGETEATNSILHALKGRLPRLLEALLRTEKGQLAIETLVEGMTVLCWAISETHGTTSIERNLDHRECIVLLLKDGASFDTVNELPELQFVWQLLERYTGAKSKELMALVNKAPRKGEKKALLAYWDPDTNPQVKAFIDREGSTRRRQCAGCLGWSDQVRAMNMRQSNGTNKSSGFQMCSICRSAWYCNKTCQKLHWSVHKKVCKPPTT